jgi:glycine/D-amino acid oxidase-like deaminating enzyme
MVCGGTSGTAYTKAAQQNDLDAGCRVVLLPTVSDIKRVFPPGVLLGELADAKDHSGQAQHSSYLNKDGGWVAATVAMKALLRRIRAYEGRGVTILGGRRVTGLELDPEGRAIGVKVFVNGSSNEEVLTGDVIVLATGAWTSSLFPDNSFGLSKLMKATG